VLLGALAPDLMLGWPEPLSPEARAFLPPVAAQLPEIPRLTGRADVTAQIEALHPDLIVDYGTISSRYAELARTTQQRTGIPTLLLDGSMAQIPNAFHLLGRVLHREARADELAKLAEALLILPAKQDAHPRVLCARGADGQTVIAPGTDVAGVFKRLGWEVVAPEGKGPFRGATIDDIRKLDPDVLVFSDPDMRGTLAKSAEWRSLRAVRDGHVLIAPDLPFGWIEEPPSINRLLGFAWLAGHDPKTLATNFYAVMYGHALTPPQLDTLLADLRPIHP
jgi:iron complex transport system substrate-binding protein